jgi:hypothetical protein
MPLGVYANYSAILSTINVRCKGVCIILNTLLVSCKNASTKKVRHNMIMPHFFIIGYSIGHCPMLLLSARWALTLIPQTLSQHRTYPHLVLRTSHLV